MSEQLKHWKSDFGDAYTDRNVVDWKTRLSAWKTMIGDMRLEHIVEVGCNRGHNLKAIYELESVSGNIIGIEPNAKALSKVRNQFPEVAALSGNIFTLPFIDGYADLVFTVGVLIHLHLDDLAKGINEIYRISKKYILCVEYFSEKEITINYRGHDNLLWKRDFKSHYLKLYPKLRVIREGYWDIEDGFDRSHWWLFEKPF